MSAVMAPGEGPLAIIAGGGTLPFAVADAVKARGRRPVMFALQGVVDPEKVKAYPHHWVRYGQTGRLLRLARAEGCRDAVWIGSMVRPRLSQVRLDLASLLLLPKLLKAFRGGDDHLLSSLGKIFEDHGFRLLGAHEVAPEILVPEGVLGRVQPSERDHADIARALELLRAIGPFDVGQAAVIAGNHVLAVEGAEGTDNMLAHVAQMRSAGRIPSTAGTGVLVKAPKSKQDRRFDLPTIGPRTIDGIARAGLAGLAVAAGATIIAEPEQVIAAADREKLFVIGVRGAG
ncbi:MAG: UDP-2,3-diacylglucosamine diphosphatase LpxI [Hyphomicrobiales bacterium]